MLSERESISECIANSVTDPGPATSPALARLREQRDGFVSRDFVRQALALCGERVDNAGRFAHRDRVAGDAIAGVRDKIAADAAARHHQPVHVLRDQRAQRDVVGLHFDAGSVNRGILVVVRTGGVDVNADWAVALAT